MKKIINYNPLCSFYVCAHVCAGVCVCTYVVATVMDQKRVDVLIAVSYTHLTLPTTTYV